MLIIFTYSKFQKQKKTPILSQLEKRYDVLNRDRVVVVYIIADFEWRTISDGANF